MKLMQPGALALFTIHPTATSMLPRSGLARYFNSILISLLKRTSVGLLLAAHNSPLCFNILSSRLRSPAGRCRGGRQVLIALALAELLAWLLWVKPGRSGSQRSAPPFVPRSPLTGPRPGPPRPRTAPREPPDASSLPRPRAPRARTSGPPPTEHITMATHPAALRQRHSCLPRSELPRARLPRPGRRSVRPAGAQPLPGSFSARDSTVAMLDTTVRWRAAPAPRLPAACWEL